MVSNNPEWSPHSSPHDYVRADKVVFNDEYVHQDDKIALLSECTTASENSNGSGFPATASVARPNTKKLSSHRDPTNYSTL